MAYALIKEHRRDLGAILLLALFVFLIFSPLFLSKKAFFEQEQFGFYYPMSLYVQKSLENNTSLLWNSAYYGGVSASLDQFVGAFYPLNLFLFKHLDVFNAHHLSILIATIVGTIMAYWFGRANKWLISSSIVLGVSYLLATTFSWLSIGTIAAHSYITFPAMALGVLKIRENKNFILYSVLGGLGFGIGLLAGFVQVVFYVWPLALLYAFFLDWKNWSENESLWKKLKASLGFLSMSVIGTLIGLRQLMPSIFFIDKTIRTSDYAIQHGSNPNIIEFLTFTIPDYIHTPFIGGGSHGFYIGVLPIIFAILGLFFYRSKTVLFFTSLYLVIIGFAFHLPIFSWLNEHIPPYRNMGGNLRWMISGALPLAYIGASGLEGFLRNPEKISDKGKNILLKILTLISVAAVVGTFLLNYFLNFLKTSDTFQTKILDKVFAKREMLFSAEHYVRILNQSIDELLSVFSLSNPEYLIPILLWPLALLVFYFYDKQHWVRDNFKKIVIIFVLFNVFIVFFFQYDDLLIQRNLFTVEPKIVESIKSLESDPNSYRIMGFLLGDSIFREVQSKTKVDNERLAILQRELLINNSNIYWDIQRMDGMEPYRTMRHNHLIDTVISSERSSFVYDNEKLPSSKLNQLHNYDVLIPVSLEDKKKDFLKKLPLLSMMNVKYIYSAYELDYPSLKKIFQDHLNVTEEIKLPIYLYENKNTLPRIYFASNPEFFTGGESSLLGEVASTLNFSIKTLIECNDCEDKFYQGGSIIIHKYQNGLVELSVESIGENWLVFGESSMPGWVGRIDGIEVPIYDTNYIFQAILVPDGEHKIIFEYRDILGLKLREYFGKL